MSTLDKQRLPVPLGTYNHTPIQKKSGHKQLLNNTVATDTPLLAPAFPQLHITSPNTPAEKEADRMAAKATQGQNANSKSGVSNVTEMDAPASAALAHQIERSKGSGTGLPNTTRQQMEQQFGTDFSQVRIHTDTRAGAMNQGIRARAFTHGNDVYFNQGEFAPHAPSGQQLLAHELTHTLQQAKNGTQPVVQREGEDKKKPEPEVKTKVEVVSETDFANGKTKVEGTTTRSATEQVSDNVSATATEKTTGEGQTGTAAVKVKDKASGLSATAGIKAENPADPQKADTAKGFVKVGGEWTPFPFVSFGVTNSVEFADLKKPKYSLDGTMVLFPNGVLKPELAAKFLYDYKGPSGGVDVGLSWDITKALSAKAGVKITLDPKGNLQASGGLGFAFSFK